MNFEPKTPVEARRAFRENRLMVPTAGLCPGYVQLNLIVLPADLTADFDRFCAANPLSCPVLERTEPGERGLSYLCTDVDIAADFPKYRVYRNGELVEEPADVRHLWQDDLVSYLIGCSFSFEEALLAAGVPVRHIEEGRNVPMYITDIDCEPAGVFAGKMVVSMRPMSPEAAERARDITARMPRVHGAPVHIGAGSAIGIRDIHAPDFGDAVTIRPGEVPVFWPCGVTPQSVVMHVRPAFAITHAPGHMLIADIHNRTLMD